MRGPCPPIAAALLCLAIACGGSGGPGADAATQDASVADVAPVDGWTDTANPSDPGTTSDGPADPGVGTDPGADLDTILASDDGPDGVAPAGPWAALCTLDCADDAACGETGRCLTFQATQQKFCALPCNPSACPDGFFCATVEDLALCVPLTGDCRTATRGATCGGALFAGLCKHDFPVCSSDGEGPGYCTRECASDLDCPAFLKRCRPAGAGAASLCRASWEDGPDGCALPGSVGATGNPPVPCGKGTCGSSATCIHAPSVDPVQSTCVPMCADGGPCGGGATCAPLALQPQSWCLPPACSCLADRDTLYDRALEAANLSRCTPRFDRHYLDLWDGAMAFDPWRLSRFHALHDDPSATLPGVRADVAALDASAGAARVAAIVRKAADLLDRPVRENDPAPAPSADLPTAVAAFITAAGGTPESAALATALGPVPSALAGKLAPVVDALTGVVLARKAISSTLADPVLEDLLFASTHGLVLPGIPFPPSPKMAWFRDVLLGNTYDFAGLYTAAARLADAVAAAGLATDPAWGAFDVRIDTPAGLLAFSGTGDDAYDPADPAWAGPIALLVDAGGNDTYRLAAGANASPKNPVSVVIDLGGDDRYGYAPSAEAIDPLLLPADAGGRYAPSLGPDQDNGPVSLSDAGRQGCGRLGVGMLWDLGEGRDAYASLRMSQGAAVLGVGVLYDDGGDDTYDAEAASQGAGIFGIGVLVDGGGSDAYTGFHMVQGFAYAAAVGALYDVAGDDRYVAHLGDPAYGGLPLYYNPQNPGKSNSSHAQGFGFGRRADMTDGVYMSGGFGILRDRAGNDRYTADIFGQGAGYWFGSGILADAEGDDEYLGRWYVQGSAAHFALGVLVDEAGNDCHNPGDVPLLNASLGCGHDFSLGILADLAGDDEYRSPSLSLGAGNDNGIGILLDADGADTYRASAANTLGWASNSDFGAGNPRNALLAVGVFLDGGGTDTYDRADLAGVAIGNEATWLMDPADPAKTDAERGVGADWAGVAAGL